MSEASTRPRFQVSNLGFSFAVHDTQAKKPYELPAGAGKNQASKNDFNSLIVAIFPTRAHAHAHAQRLNGAPEIGR